MRTTLVVSPAALGAGLAVVFAMHTLLGALLIVGGMAGLGWVAWTVWLGRVVVFLSTGTWRR